MRSKRPTRATPACRSARPPWPTRCGRATCVRPGRSDVVQPRPLRAQRRARVDAALRAAPPDRLRPDARRPQGLPPARAARRRATRSTTTPPASRSPPARSGQGFGNAVGLAIAEAHLAATYRTATGLVDHYTYVMAGDGDMMEGIASEAASLAGHLKLGKLICLYDDNKISLAGADRRSRSPKTSASASKRTAGTCSTSTSTHAQRRRRRSTRRLKRRKATPSSPRSSSSARTSASARRAPDTFAAHGEPLGADNVTKRKKRSAGRSSRRSSCPTTCCTYFDGRKAAGAQSARGVERSMRDWKARQRRSRRATRTRARRETARRPAVAHVQRRERRVATRDAGGTVMNAIAKALPELVGGSADLDPSTKTYLKDFGDFEPGTYAGRNMHFGVREHAMAAAINGIALHGGLLPFGATFFNFLDYCKPSLRLAALNELRCDLRLHARLGLSRARTARRTSRSNSSRCCARRRTSSTSVRPTRSRRSRRGSSPIAAEHRPDR